jgi:2-C-methyl-D-erythritol 4-phosphate cytidylyltransferase
VDARVRVVRRGGSTRARTVANGLAELMEQGARSDDWVLVHDAARCLIRPAWVDRLIDACNADPVGGLLALPVADTLKSERGGRATSTLDRRAIWQAQTPQMFRIGALAAALDAAGDAVTDEAGAIERSGQQPLLVPGALENFKLTYPADFALAERLLGVPARSDR